jgi:glutathione S-transferase
MRRPPMRRRLIAAEKSSDRINIADIAMATTLALHELAGGDLSAAPGIVAWLGKLKERPSFVATAPRMG